MTFIATLRPHNWIGIAAIALGIGGTVAVAFSLQPTPAFPRIESPPMPAPTYFSVRDLSPPSTEPRAVTGRLAPLDRPTPPPMISIHGRSGAGTPLLLTTESPAAGGDFTIDVPGGFLNYRLRVATGDRIRIDMPLDLPASGTLNVGLLEEPAPSRLRLPATEVLVSHATQIGAEIVPNPAPRLGLDVSVPSGTQWLHFRDLGVWSYRLPPGRLGDCALPPLRNHTFTWALPPTWPAPSKLLVVSLDQPQADVQFHHAFVSPEVATDSVIRFDCRLPTGHLAVLSLSVDNRGSVYVLCHTIDRTANTSVFRWPTPVGCHRLRIAADPSRMPALFHVALHVSTICDVAVTLPASDSLAVHKKRLAPAESIDAFLAGNMRCYWTVDGAPSALLTSETASHLLVTDHLVANRPLARGHDSENDSER